MRRAPGRWWLSTPVRLPGARVSMSLARVCSSCPAHPAPTTPPACPFYPASSITDAQWRILQPLLPPPGTTRGKGGRPERHPRRLIRDAIFYLVRGGIAWAQLPHDFPPYHTVYGIYGCWAKARRHGLAGLAGDRCGSGVVLAGFGGGVAT